MKRISLILFCGFACVLASPAMAGAPCGPGYHEQGGAVGAPCVPDTGANGPSVSPYVAPGASGGNGMGGTSSGITNPQSQEFGTPTLPATGASGAGPSNADISSQLGRYGSLTSLEKQRAEYLKYKLLADSLASQDNQQETPGEVNGAPIPLYLTAVYGSPDNLVGTLLFNGAVWKVRVGTVIAPGVTVTALDNNHATVNFHGTPRLLGLTSYAEIQNAARQQLGGLGAFGSQNRFGTRPAIPLTTNGAVGPIPQTTPSDLPPGGGV